MTVNVTPEVLEDRLRFPDWTKAIESSGQINKPDISNSAQCDFFPLAASSADMMVYNRRGSGGSYFSFGIPVNLREERHSQYKL